MLTAISFTGLYSQLMAQVFETQVREQKQFEKYFKLDENAPHLMSQLKERGVEMDMPRFYLK